MAERRSSAQDQRADAHVAPRRDERGDDGGLGLGPPGAQTGCDDLAERSDFDDAVASSERVQRWRRRLVEPQLAVGIVLDDKHIVEVADLDQAVAPLDRQRRAGRVVEVGDRVEQPHPLAAVGQLLESLLEHGDIEPVVVDGNALEPRRHRTDRANRSGEAGGLDTGDVTRVEERLAHVRQRTRAPIGEAVVGGVERGALDGGPVLGQPVTDALEALRASVLQRGVGVGREHVADRGCQFDGREQGGIGQADGERNRPGLEPDCLRGRPWPRVRRAGSASPFG